MKTLIEGFPQQLKDAIAIADKVPFRYYEREFSSVLVLGLGGSAFGAEIVKNVAHHTAKAPIMISRGYDIPGWVNSNTFVIACSYSGNTEETLMAVDIAHKRGSQIICVTSGGELRKFAQVHNHPVIELPGGFPPRAACGYSMVQQLAILHHLKLIPAWKPDLLEAIALLEGFDAHAAAREVAQGLKGRYAAIYSADIAESMAIRWRQQINENSKQLCWHHVVPEMNHNELVGWHHPVDLMPHTAVVQLRTQYDHKRVARRFEITEPIYRQHTPHIFDIQAEGKSLMAQLLYLLHFGDWVSLYLAELNGVEPTPVAVIDYLKGALAEG
jgi:glucose/mannose-6-phosphate isomerase